MNETRQFKMHAKLLFDVIQRQAGSLGKGVLEGVMNAVDARATQVSITVKDGTLRISDDGAGFRSRQEIEEWFETFGQPHEQDEKKIFGTFRMGRGQLLARGVNTWRSGEFQMIVDIKNKGLDYQLTSGLPPVQGCQIDIALYDHIGEVGVRDIEDDLRAAVKWLRLPVSFNDKEISNDPANARWDIETEEAFFRFKDEGQLVIYQLGVRVQSIYGSKYGIAGEVVSKQSMKLNFARNDVMDDCPVWKKIVSTIDTAAGKEVRKKGENSLSESQRLAVAKRMVKGTISAEDAWELRVFTDVNGRRWSLKQLASSAHYRFRGGQCTMAKLGDGKGDKLMQLNVAFVFASVNLETFGLPDLSDLLGKVVNRMIGGLSERKWESQSYQKLTGALDDHHELLPEEEWTQIERAIVRTIETVQQSCFLSKEIKTRRVCIGEAGCAAAWTDGQNYVAFDRGWLREQETGLMGWVAIAETWLHEYCHDAPDTDTHNHSPEFFEQFHELSHELLPQFVDQAVDRYATNIASEGRRLNRKQLKERDRLVVSQQATEKVTT